jgi:hypothetical protein
MLKIIDLYLLNGRIVQYVHCSSIMLVLKAITKQTNQNRKREKERER